MADPTSILVDNLKETFRAIERFLFIGFTSALLLIVVAVTHRGLAGDAKMMFINLDAPSALVAGVALAAYWACGTFAALHFRGRVAIVKRLRQAEPLTLDAVLTYPSVGARAGWWQTTAILGLVACGVIAMRSLYPSGEDTTRFVLASVFFALPYIVLSALVFLAAVNEAAAQPVAKDPAGAPSN